FSYSSRPPHPSSTLFPYTTLFRSPIHRLGDAGLRDADDILDRANGNVPGLGSRADDVERFRTDRDAGGGGAVAGIARVVQRIGRDRKSTRLNSSHDQISYAVFCLK